jgi:hypothetical protein
VTVTVTVKNIQHIKACQSETYFKTKLIVIQITQVATKEETEHIDEKCLWKPKFAREGVGLVVNFPLEDVAKINTP